MKKLRRLWYHASDDFGILLVGFALLLAGCLVWLLADQVLGAFR